MQKTTYVERVLIVLNPDGTPKGAAQYTLTRLLDDDGVTPLAPDQQGIATELDPATISALVGDKAVLVANAARLETEVASLGARLSEAIAANDSLARGVTEKAAEIAELRDQLSGLQQAIKDKGIALELSQARVVALEQQLAATASNAAA